VVSDATVEALADRLQSAPRGLLCERDELSGLLNGLNQYKSKGGADVAYWLEMHRAGSLLIDRKTGDQKIIHASRAFMALTGTIQPGVLRRALTPEYMEAGLAARLLVAMPPVKRRKWSEATVRDPVKKQYADTLAALMAIPMGGNADTPEPVDLPMTAGAKKLWINFYNEHNAAEQASEGGDLAAAWSKLEGYAARLALVIHCVRAVSGETDPVVVDAESMASGIALVRWFGGEAERAYTTLAGDGVADARVELWEYIVREHDGRITTRDLAHAKSKYRPSGSAREALNDLVEGGYGRWIEMPSGEKGGHPVTVFEAAKPVTEPPESISGNSGNGNETPAGAIENEGFVTVTNVTAANNDGFVTAAVRGDEYVEVRL
jgi:hypothetical protein